MPYASKEAQAEYQRGWVRARRAAFFKGKSCAQCGSTERLELDHINPSEKITHSVWSWGAVRRMAELAKCQVLCASCHLKKSLAERKPPQHGGGAYKHGCRCKLCVAWNRERVRRQRGQSKSRPTEKPSS